MDPNWSLAELRLEQSARSIRQPDWSAAELQASQGEYTRSCEIVRPSVIYRPDLSIDGNQWCALFGDDIQSGVAGFGESPELAMNDFDMAWRRRIVSNG